MKIDCTLKIKSINLVPTMHLWNARLEVEVHPMNRVMINPVVVNIHTHVDPTNIPELVKELEEKTELAISDLEKP